MIDGIRDLLADEGFRTGLRFGLMAVAVVAVVALIGRRSRPWAGIAFVVAGVLAIDDAFTVENEMVIALAVLAVGGFLAMRFPPPVWAIAAVPGAVLFTRATELDEPGWAFATILAATLVGGLLMADFDKSFARTGLPPVLLAISLLGVYVTTPETQHAILLTGAALPLALLGWPRPLGSLGVGGSFAATALVSWTVVLDGSFRPSSVVGGLACLGMFAIEPVVRRVLGVTEVRQVLWVAGLHLVVVGACSRVAGLRDSTTQALVLTALAYVAAGVALAVVERRSRLTGADGGRGDAAHARTAAGRTRGTSAFPHIG
jgi:hypothetical protein